MNTAAATKIRQAYTELATYHGRTWVRLAELREEAGLSRPDFDAAITAMGEDGHANLIPESRQADLTHADRAAALRFGGQDKHLVSM